ncbi:hypothetical protein [Nonomuraea angiospora]
MRNTVVAAVLGLLVLSACSSPTPDSQSEPAASSNASQPVSGVPSPDAGQSAKLLAALAEIDPALEHERSISRARDTCQTLLSGEDRAKVVDMARQRFDGGSASVSAADAEKIVKLVEDSGWCKP